MTLGMVASNFILASEEPIDGPDESGTICGCSSVVERHVANVKVARSNRVTRSWTITHGPTAVRCRFCARCDTGSAGHVSRVS